MSKPQTYPRFRHADQGSTSNGPGEILGLSDVNTHMSGHNRVKQGVRTGLLNFHYSTALLMTTDLEQKQFFGLFV